jgi:disulfide bond formation protein DsbB
MVNVDTVSLFLALLAVVAEIGVVAAIVLIAGSKLSPRMDGWRRSAVEAIAPQALTLAFAVAAVATAGSLYFSEVAHFTPCRLCWYQRVCMYPLVPLLGMAAWRRDRGIRPYAAVLAAAGAVIASYHVVLERFPTLESDVCDPANPCTLIWVQRLGYLTIPTMALSGFALVLMLLAVAGHEPSTALEGESCQSQPSRNQAARAEPRARPTNVASRASGSHSAQSSSSPH